MTFNNLHDLGYQAVLAPNILDTASSQECSVGHYEIPCKFDSLKYRIMVKSQDIIDILPHLTHASGVAVKMLDNMTLLGFADPASAVEAFTGLNNRKNLASYYVDPYTIQAHMQVFYAAAQFTTAYDLIEYFSQFGPVSMARCRKSCLEITFRTKAAALRALQYSTYHWVSLLECVSVYPKKLSNESPHAPAPYSPARLNVIRSRCY